MRKEISPARRNVTHIEREARVEEDVGRRGIRLSGQRRAHILSVSLGQEHAARNHGDFAGGRAIVMHPRAG